MGTCVEDVAGHAARKGDQSVSVMPGCWHGPQQTGALLCRPGAGHIGLCVPDVEAACARFEELGVEFVKKPNDGKMR